MVARSSKRERARLRQWAEREAFRPGGRREESHRSGGLEYLAGDDPRPGYRVPRGSGIWDHQNRSPYEEALARALVRAGITGFERNASFGPWELDFIWRRQRLVVEVDGFTHLASRQREADRRKEAALKERGYRVLRFQNGEVRARPDACARRIREALRGS